ncbi:Asp23/Gls24 family envelope stress response protein [Streptomyces sp. NPDC006990]|uniref:Asp23/Gls24 family envelope stress response protein n=1 Tax=unclassified Streptomyces TaxID=2593676 RepID=UPI003454202B
MTTQQTEQTEQTEQQTQRRNTPVSQKASRAQQPDKPATGTTEVAQGASGVDQPAPTRGKTSIADVVVVKIAGIAAREIPGVYDMGGGLSRTIGAVRDRVPGGRPNVGRGVKVEVGERQTAIDLELVVDYGVSITDVAADVRENVIGAVERITGLEVVEVNIAVIDVHLPEDDTEDGSADSRVE